MQRKDLWIAPLCEGALLLIVGVAGWLSRQPLLFTSLGPTAYELIETPKRRSAQPYSIFVGHLAGVACGFFAVWVTHAWNAPVVSTSGVTPSRLWAVVIAAALTVLLNLLLRASQPASLSTTLLVALGSMQKPIDAALIMGAVALMILVGEPLRSWRARTKEEDQPKAES